MTRRAFMIDCSSTCAVYAQPAILRIARHFSAGDRIVLFSAHFRHFGAIKIASRFLALNHDDFVGGVVDVDRPISHFKAAGFSLIVFSDAMPDSGFSNYVVCNGGAVFDVRELGHFDAWMDAELEFPANCRRIERLLALSNPRTADGGAELAARAGDRRARCPNQKGIADSPEKAASPALITRTK